MEYGILEVYGRVAAKKKKKKTGGRQWATIPTVSSRFLYAFISYYSWWFNAFNLSIVHINIDDMVYKAWNARSETLIIQLGSLAYIVFGASPSDSSSFFFTIIGRHGLK